MKLQPVAHQMTAIPSKTKNIQSKFVSLDLTSYNLYLSILETESFNLTKVSGRLTNQIVSQRAQTIKGKEINVKDCCFRASANAKRPKLMFCLVFHCLGSSSSLVPRMGAMGGKKYLSRRKRIETYIPRGIKVVGFIRAFLHLRSFGKQFSLSVSCFFMSYQQRY